MAAGVDYIYEYTTPHHKKGHDMNRAHLALARLLNAIACCVLIAAGLAVADRITAYRIEADHAWRDGWNAAVAEYETGNPFEERTDR